MADNIAFTLIFGLALTADDLMDASGPLGFLLIGGVVLAIAGALLLTKN